MKAFRCDSCGEYYDNQPSKVVRVIFGSDNDVGTFKINSNSLEPDICEDCQVKIAKMFPMIKIRDKVTKEEL